MIKPQNIIEDVLIASGLTISLMDVQQILSVILLVFNVIWILVKCGVKVYEHIKEKNIHAVVDDIEQTKDELEKLSNDVKDSKDKQ